MTEKKFCDLCQEEMHQFDKTFVFSYGEGGLLARMRMKSGEICANCCKEVDKFIQKLKK